MDQRYKMIFFCQRCRKEHDRTNEPMFEANVKCNYCEGFVVSPSGRANIQLQMLVGIYVVYGETSTAWIAARNRVEAVNHFKDEVEGRHNDVQKLSDNDVQVCEFTYDIEQTGNPDDFVLLNGKDLLNMIPEIPAILYLVTNEQLEEIRRKNAEMFEVREEDDDEL